MKKLISIFILSLFVMALTYFANSAYNASLKYENAYKEYTSSKSLEKNIENATKILLNNLISSLITGEHNIQDKKQTNIQLQNIKKYENIVQINLQYFIIILLISLFTYFIFSRTIVLAYLHIVSMGSLIFGLISPMFLMYIQKEIANNNVILQFESSNILSSIEKLFLENNYFVGGIILIFSIIFPIIKTLISFLALSLSNAKILNKISDFSSKISKFSMTDVFVLSIFLVYLSPKANGIIKTQLEVGFYFFFTYVILSLLTGLLQNKNTNN